MLCVVIVLFNKRVKKKKRQGTFICDRVTIILFIGEMREAHPFFFVLCNLKAEQRGLASEAKRIDLAEQP